MGGFRGSNWRNNLARRNKREPFNPFAPGASAKPQKKTQKHRPETSKTQLPTLSRQEKMDAMRKKIREQQEKKKVAEESSLKKEIESKKVIIEKSSELNEEKKIPDSKKSTPTVVEVSEVKEENASEKKIVDKSKNISKNKSSDKENIKSSSEKIKAQAETSKLDDLKRRSDALAAKTGVQLPATELYKGTLFSNKKEEKSPNPVAKPKKPVRKTKKGGGKQPKQKKLNRRKQLEFRFDARAILDNSSVAEEHRSNIFGQIWAKGERIGIDSAIEYVSLKQQEGILTEDISNELVVLIKNYTIKR